MGREENALIFKDTEYKVKSVEILKDAVKSSTLSQKLYLEKDNLPDVNRGRYDKEANIIVSKKRTLEAASAYKGERVCVHNFASAVNPGGGVINGASAQEECLCRCSTLYFSLNTLEMWDNFYIPHRKEENPIHNDDCIYTQNVVVFKTDTAFPETMEEKDWYSVNVVTCAAPNLRGNTANSMNSGYEHSMVNVIDRELYELHVRRLRRILDVAVLGNNSVVILGAFGCGAFQNNPEIVARAAKDVIEDYKYAFKTIEFAVYCSPRNESNYRIFERTFR